MRTWNDNKDVINQLWPTQWNPEEWKLIHEDLSPLDQAILYDAIRNAKRKHDTPFVHLKWLLDEYRELAAARKQAIKATKPKDPKLQIEVNDEQDRKLSAEFVTWIDICEPKNFPEVEAKVLDYLPKMHAISVIKILGYARARLLGEKPAFSRVTSNGELTPMAGTKEGTW